MVPTTATMIITSDMTPTTIPAVSPIFLSVELKGNDTDGTLIFPVGNSM